MSIRLTLRGLQTTAAIAGIVVAASGLAGCSTFGMGGTDQMATGSTGYAGTSNLNQPMPGPIGAQTRVAQGPYVPPEDIGGVPAPRLPMVGQGYGGQAASHASPNAITSQDLPVIGATTSNGSPNAMSAQPAQSLVPSAVAPKPVVASAPSLSVVPTSTYTHVIRSGESLYTIAKHYGVTAQAIMHASGITAPDKIFVGQRVAIPGRPDLLAAMDSAKPSSAAAVAAEAEALPVDSSKPVLASAAPEPMPMSHGAPAETHVASLGNAGPVVPLAGRINANGIPASVAPQHAAPQTHAATPGQPKPLTPKPAPTPTAAAPSSPAAPAPTQVATANPSPKMPLEEPAMSGADKFRWPVSGKVITDFSSSRGTGINIAAPEGTPIKAAENGTVIYVGSGVEGYGNLVLIRHANGYVSAYAYLKDMSVQKGQTVGRGDVIGSAGTTGAAQTPQLHFELRKGATPVDPVPLLAG
jgi:murein DD-endopeptidase MepM/ murein hydrolase activator NlpD